MDFIKTSITKPVTIAVGVLLLLMFGFVSLEKLPYRLTPNVVQPEISIQTIWPGATPYEIEREVITKQEEQLKSIQGLVKYISTSSDNRGEVTLTFQIGTDMNKALLEVSNKLDQVDRYPENVNKPIINSSGANASPVVWMGLVADKDNPRDINTYKTFVENNIKEEIERVEGVASLFEGGGTPEELHIQLDQERLAAHNLTIDQIANIVRAENADISAGSVDIDRRTYRVRTAGALKSVEAIENIVVIADGQREVKLKELADVSKGYQKKSVKILQRSQDLAAPVEAIVMGVRPEPNTNIVDLTNRVEKVVNHLNEAVLPEHKIHIEWFYDQRKYINGAIELVQQNILVGAVLAIIVLMLFLRSISSTTVVALAIPISIISTFTILLAMDRSLNTISLAGISFAVGMLLDSAIVVLENIDRHRKLGKKFFEAAYDGANEVWGALIASALTTIAVFLPIIFLQDEAGQLFKDIAIAVTSAISFSLFVSISVIPMIWTQIMKRTAKHEHTLSKEELQDKHHHTSLLVDIGRKINRFLMAIVTWSLKNVKNQLLTVATLSGVSVLIVYTLFPKMEYLPQGNQNFIMNILLPPPGLSYEEREDIGEQLFELVSPHFAQEEVDGIPPIRRMFFVSRGDFVLSGIMSTEEQRAKELIPAMVPKVNSFPGVFGISLQRGVFEQGIGEGRSIDLDITGANIDQLAQIGGMLFGAVKEVMPTAQIRPVPSIELLFPEAKISPDRFALTSVGMSTSSFGFAADVLLDGRKIDDFTQEGKNSIDLILKSNKEIRSPEELLNTQVATPSSGLVPLANLAQMERTTGITQIRHSQGRRTITLQVTPPESITLEEAMATLEEGIIQNFSKNPAVQGANISLSGQADKLTQTVSSMKWNLIFAIAIVYLLMSALFGNFIYPIVILFTVPMAAAGGFIGLYMTNMFIAPQPLDILTMLGFIILIGIVVNNAILIVHQSLNNIRNFGFKHKQAVIAATHSRLRPIFMSSLTSISGMIPLVLVPGPGSEFYRGLGSVITGGLAFSTFFTIFVIPAMLFFVIKMEKLKNKTEKEDEL